jgi:L-2,4-diaminobutyrate decarboxylase
MTNFKNAYDPEIFRQQAHELIDSLADYLAEVTKENSSIQAIPYRTPETALAYWNADFAQPNLASPTQLLEDVLANSTHLHSPRYVGHQVTAPLPSSILGGWLDTFLSNSGAVYEMGMTINTLEYVVTNWFAQQIGYDAKAYGFITSGGTLANLTALLTARAVKAPEDVWKEGTKSRLAIMVSEQAHYCVDRAARILGLGDEGIIKVPTNENFQLRTELLESLLADAKERDLVVFAVIGSACTTSTGSYDDLNAIADFCEKHQLWMHTDGAHGGVATLSEKYKPLVKGMERSDSVIVDFHKMLLVSALTTGVFYKNTKDSYRTFSQKASYLFETQDEDWFNSGKRTFECTKSGNVLRIYTTLRTHGKQIFTDVVDYLYDLGKTFATMVQQHSNFELALEPQTNIVCFRYLGNETTQDLNELNATIRMKLIESGRFYIVQTILNHQLYLRVSLMNPLTTTKELEELLEDITKIVIA